MSANARKTGDSALAVVSGLMFQMVWHRISPPPFRSGIGFQLTQNRTQQIEGQNWPDGQFK
jgi:hypothetical protein